MVHHEKYNSVRYDGWETHVMQDDETGNSILCVNPSKTMADTGTYEKHFDFENYMEENSDGEVSKWRKYLVRALEYYCNPDSPGAKTELGRSIWPAKYYDGAADFSRKEKLSTLHVALAMIMNGSGWRTGTSSDFQEWVETYISGGYGWSDGSDYHRDSIIGRLGNFAAGSHSPDWSESNPYLAALPGGLDNDGAFRVYVVATSSGTQNYVGFDYSDVAVSLRKAVDNSDLASNPMYSVGGAVFAAYDNAEDAQAAEAEAASGAFTSKARAESYAGETKADAVLVTDEEGRDKATGLARGKYWVVELYAPVGCERHQGAIKINTAREDADGELYSEENPYVLNVADRPQMVQVPILLEKVGELGEPAKPDGDAKLAGAVFKVEYFACAANADGAPQAASPERTWHFRTDASGRVDSSGAGGLAPGYASDALYADASGAVAFPIGTYRVTEVEPPEGYLVSADLQYFTISAGADQNSTVAAGPVRFGNHRAAPDGTSAFSDSPQRGGLMVGKGDAAGYDGESTGGDGNCYDYAQGDSTFAGAEFTIYNRSASDVWDDLDGDGELDSGEVFQPGDAVLIISTGYNADLDAFTAQTGPCELPYGTYEVVETKAPEGHLGNEAARKTVEIRSEGEFRQLVYADGVLNEVVRGGVQVRKDDLELGEGEALGGAGHASLGDGGYLGTSLAGIEFTIANASGHGILSGGKWFHAGDTVAKIYTHWNEEEQAYTAELPADALPYGTYTVAETATNDSYLLTDGEPRTFEIREEGAIVTASTDSESLVWRDQVVRHDMHLQKKASDGSGKLAKVPFLITNVTTGEAHVAVTDRNGMLNTAAGWRKHTEKTNANDALADAGEIASDDVVEDAGVWFGLGEHGSTAEPDDSLAALPYGQYTVEELRCEANEGMELWSELFNVSRDTTVTSFDVDLGTVDDAAGPRIGTEASDGADGDKDVVASDGARVADTVAYANLKPGREYTLEGTLMVKSTGKALSGPDGGPVTASTTFVPIAPFGTVEVGFAFDGGLLAGEELVAFERLTSGGEEVAAHCDIDDEGQTVALVPPEEPPAPEPKISTKAADAADGDHEVAAGEAEIADEVQYDGLEPGTDYTATGTLIDKETGKPVQSGGKDVTATVAFKPDKPSGSVKVSFKVDATELAGKTLVVFESLSRDDEEIASHADIDSAEQSVAVAKPSAKTPLAPEPELEAPQNGTLPQTGDSLPWVPVACFAVAAACLMAVAMLARRRGMKENVDGGGADPDDAEDDDDEIVWQDVHWE